MRTCLSLCLFLFSLSCCIRKEQPSNTLVYITYSGSKYHLADCPYLGRSTVALSLAEAAQRGYEPCGECHPPFMETREQPVQDSSRQKEIQKPAATKAEKKQCTAFTKKGARCKRAAKPGSSTCWQHSEKTSQ